MVELEQVAAAVPSLCQRRGQRQRAAAQGAVLVGHDDATGRDRPGREHAEAARAGVAHEEVGAVRQGAAR